MSHRLFLLLAYVLIMFSVTAVCIKNKSVDLGYARYQSYRDEEFDLDIWKGIRYAAPVIGESRWNRPRHPRKMKIKSVILADQDPPRCMQLYPKSFSDMNALHEGDDMRATGEEDCLFLNVFAPAGDATDLPVLFWIHGGDWNRLGALDYDPRPLMETNNNGFITVVIQYRLGLFGFIADPRRNLTKVELSNFGLHDQRLALEWVHEHIHRFGGDRDKVTIGGDSTGGTSAIFQALAYDGKATKLFNNIIAASPLMRPVHDARNHSDTKLGTLENDGLLKTWVGCMSEANMYDIRKCMYGKSAEELCEEAMYADLPHGVHFGSHIFLPLQDKDLLTHRPTDQLRYGTIAGKRLLIGTTANEGANLVRPRHIHQTGGASLVNKQHLQQSKYKFWAQFQLETFPRFSTECRRDFRQKLQTTDRGFHVESEYHGADADLMDKMNILYNIYDDGTKAGRAKAETPEYNPLGPFGISISTSVDGVGQATQFAFNEAFVQCPAEWAAEAMSFQGGEVWKYLHAVLPNYHGADIPAYFPSLAGPGTGPRKLKPLEQNDKFVMAVRRMWGNFIMYDRPHITVREATGGEEGAQVPVYKLKSGQTMKEVWDREIEWPEYNMDSPMMLVLNMTGGWKEQSNRGDSFKFDVMKGPGLRNNFRLADSQKWEANRGDRCQFWRDNSDLVPY